MELAPVIASYTGESYRAIRAFLTAEVLHLIARIAEAPVPAAELDRRVVDVLVEMHVLREVDGVVRLDTSVFTEDDIIRISAVVAPLGRRLAASLAEAAPPCATSRRQSSPFSSGCSACSRAWETSCGKVAWPSTGPALAASTPAARSISMRCVTPRRRWAPTC